MQFGLRLRSLRDGSGLSQGQLAERAGVSIDSIQNWEQDRTQPRLEALPKLASALGVSLDILLSGQGDESPSPARKRGRPPKATPSTPPEGEVEATEKRRGNRERK